MSSVFSRQSVATAPLEWEGALEEQARKPAFSVMFYTKPRVKAFIGVGFMHCFSFLRLLCAVVASLFCVPLFAQDIDTVSCKELFEVEVLSHSRPSALRASAPTKVMEQSDFRRVGALSLDEAVKRMSGVDVRDYGGVGGLKTVSVRGLGAKHTAVSYDGVLLADAQSGQVDLGRLSLENVGLLTLSVADDDIARSASEFASASLLALRALRPNDNDGYVRLRGGSFGLADAAFYFSRCFSPLWSSSFYVDFLRSDGMYPFNLVNGNNVTREVRRGSDVCSLSFEGNLFGSVCGGALQVKASGYNSERGLPGAVNLYNKENSERLWDDDFSLQTSYDLPLGTLFTLKARAKYEYSYSEYLEVNKNYFSGQQVDKNVRHVAYASLGFKYSPLRALSFALTSDISYSALNNNFNETLSPRRVNSMTVLAAQFERPRFLATASLLGTYVADETIGGAGPEPFKRLSPSVAISFAPLRSMPLRLRLSYKDSYRVPTFADLYYLRLGNIGLKPEKATQFNVGVNWSGSLGGVVDYLSLAVDGYYNKVRDKIVALPTMYVWRMMNFGEAKIVGVDADATLQLSLCKDISLLFDAGYSFQYAVDVTDSSSKNYCHQLPYTPRHTGKFVVSFLSDYVNLSWLITAVGERYMLPQNSERNRMDGYVEHSLSANREFMLGSCGLLLSGEVLNVGDCRYEVIRYYPMPGISWRLSARLSF